LGEQATDSEQSPNGEMVRESHSRCFDCSEAERTGGLGTLRRRRTILQVYIVQLLALISSRLIVSHCKNSMWPPRP
jgi:hypothetical protein